MSEQEDLSVSHGLRIVPRESPSFGELEDGLCRLLECGYSLQIDYVRYEGVFVADLQVDDSFLFRNHRHAVEKVLFGKMDVPRTLLICWLDPRILSRQRLHEMLVGHEVPMPIF